LQALQDPSTVIENITAQEHKSFENAACKMTISSARCIELERRRDAQAPSGV